MRLMTGGREESNKEIGSRQSIINLMYFMEKMCFLEIKYMKVTSYFYFFMNEPDWNQGIYIIIRL